MYGWDIVAYNFEPEEDEDAGDPWDNYCTADEIGSYWEEYNCEEHDMLRCGGGSFEEDFERLAR